MPRIYSVSPLCVKIVKSFEGFSSTPYLCPSKVWTIGYGHTDGVTRDTPITTEARASEILAADLVAFSHRISRFITAELSQDQVDALVSFAFNVGVGAFSTSTLLRRLNAGDVSGAASEFDRWVYAAGGTKLSGLVARRAAERALFESPQSGAVS